MEEHERDVRTTDEKFKKRQKKLRPTMKVSGRGMKRFAGRKIPKR